MGLSAENFTGRNLGEPGPSGKGNVVNIESKRKYGKRKHDLRVTNPTQEQKIQELEQKIAETEEIVRKNAIRRKALLAKLEQLEIEELRDSMEPAFRIKDREERNKKIIVQREKIKEVEPDPKTVKELADLKAGLEKTFEEINTEADKVEIAEGAQEYDPAPAPEINLAEEPTSSEESMDENKVTTPGWKNKRAEALSSVDERDELVDEEELRAERELADKDLAPAVKLERLLEERRRTQEIMQREGADPVAIHIAAKKLADLETDIKKLKK